MPPLKTQASEVLVECDSLVPGNSGPRQVPSLAMALLSVSAGSLQVLLKSPREDSAKHHVVQVAFSFFNSVTSTSLPLQWLSL